MSTTGYRFRPNDREIINDYLLQRMNGHDFSYVIRDIDLCRHEPWELPGMSKLEDDEVWYFFCRPDYKYRNSKRANRTTGSGYWKPTGKVRPIRGQGGEEIGTKRTLVFYSKSSTGGSVSGRTTWVIHEYQVHNVLPGQTEFGFCKLKDKEGEQTTGSILEEAEPGVQVGIDAGCQTHSAAITSEATQGMSVENWLQVNHHPFEDTEDLVDPSFADSFLVDPEESVEHVLLSAGDYEQQRPTEHCYRVDRAKFSDTDSDLGRRENPEQDGSSRMNSGHGSARQFRQTTSVQTIHETRPPLSHDDVDHSRTEVIDTSAPEICCLEVFEDYAEPEFRGSPYKEVSLMRHKWHAQAVFPTTKSANPAKGHTLHSCRKSVKVTDLKKALPRQASASVINTETSSFTDRKNASSTHPAAPESVYLVNMIIGLILLVVFIIQMLSMVVPFW